VLYVLPFCLLVPVTARLATRRYCCKNVGVVRPRLACWARLLVAYFRQPCVCSVGYRLEEGTKP